MYSEVSSKLFVASGGTAYSQAVSMAGANALQTEFTVFNSTAAGTITLAIEEGNDLENWAATLGTVTGGTIATAASYGSFKVTGIAAQYVRMKYTTASAGFVIGAGINTAQL